MILNFAKQNAFKVGSDSVLEEERSGGWGRGGEVECRTCVSAELRIWISELVPSGRMPNP